MLSFAAVSGAWRFQNRIRLAGFGVRGGARRGSLALSDRPSSRILGDTVPRALLVRRAPWLALVAPGRSDCAVRLESRPYRLPIRFAKLETGPTSLLAPNLAISGRGVARRNSLTATPVARACAWRDCSAASAFGGVNRQMVEGTFPNYVSAPPDGCSVTGYFLEQRVEAPPHHVLYEFVAPDRTALMIAGDVGFQEAPSLLRGLDGADVPWWSRRRPLDVGRASS